MRSGEMFRINETGEPEREERRNEKATVKA